MPTVLASGPYRFFFFSADRDEPPRVHIERDDKHARFWLKPVRLEESVGFARLELGRPETLVEQNSEALLKAWEEFFGA